MASGREPNPSTGGQELGEYLGRSLGAAACLLGRAGLDLAQWVACEVCGVRRDGFRLTDGGLSRAIALHEPLLPLPRIRR